MYDKLKKKNFWLFFFPNTTQYIYIISFTVVEVAGLKCPVGQPQCMQESNRPPPSVITDQHTHVNIGRIDTMLEDVCPVDSVCEGVEVQRHGTPEVGQRDDDIAHLHDIQRHQVDFCVARIEQEAIRCCKR